MMYRPGCLGVHCVLFIILTTFTNFVFADATLYGLPAFEGAFLTAAFQSTSIGMGNDGVITVIDKAATDPITAHGTFEATYVQSGDTIFYHASGPLYVESMACAIDTKLSKAQCTLSQSISGEGVRTQAFPLTTLFVAAVVPTASPTVNADPNLPLQTGNSQIGPRPTATPNSKTKANGSNSSGLPISVIIAIIASAVVVILLIAIWFIIRRRRARLQEQADLENARPPSLHYPHYPRMPETAATTDFRGMDSRSVVSYPVTHSRSSFPSMSMIGSPVTPSDGLEYYDPPPSSRHGRSNTITTRASSTYTPMEGSSASEEKERMRQFYLANSEERVDIRSVGSSSTAGAGVPREGSVSVTEARQILEEMRRMREEVEQLRGASPPEYTA